MAAAITGVRPIRMWRPERAKVESRGAVQLEVPAGHFWLADGSLCWRAILCQEGLLWITQEGDLEDHLVAAGEMFLVSQPGKVIAQALADARIEITPCLAATAFRGRFEDTIFE